MAPVRAGGSRPFVGRPHERTLLRHLVREAGAGRPSVVVVTGMPGAGKTALLRWASEVAAATGAFVLQASGSEAPVPLDALRRLTAPLPELGTVIDRAGEHDHAGGGALLGAEIAGTLAARARRRLVAVVVDDTHDLDRSTTAVLGTALASLDDDGGRAGLRLLVLLASREPVADESLASRALRLATGRPVTIGGFDAQDVRDLLALSGQRATPRLVDDVMESSGGLPLLVESAIDRRARAGDTGELAGQGARVDTIAGELRARFRRLDATALDVLRLAAVVGEPWDPADLLAAGPHDAPTVTAAMAQAADALVVRTGRPGLRFAHPLVRTELLDGLGDEGRQALHRVVAERLAATADTGDAEVDDERAVRVADHLLRGRRPPRRGGQDTPVPPEVAAWCRRAAAVTARWGAWHEAARFGGAAAAAAATGDPGEAGRLYLDAGRAAYLDHDPERAEDLLTGAIRHAGPAGDPATVLRAAMFLARRRAGSRFRIGTRIETGELEAALAAAAEEAGPVEVAGVVEAESAMAEALMVSGETERALAVVARARARAAGDGGPAVERALGRLDFAEGIHHLRGLDLAAAGACFAAGARRSAVDDPQTALLHRSRLALALLMQGAVAAARDDASAVEDDAVAHGWVGEAGFAAAQLAVGHALAGAAGAAATIEALERAHRRWRATGYTYTLALVAPVVAAVGARTAGEAAVLDDVVGPVPRSSVAAALAAVEAGDADGARARLRRARWRHGFRGPVTQNTDAVAIALVEVGDLVDEPAVVASAAGAVESLYERGVVVTLGWPALVPRLGAVVARHAGDAGRARRLLDHAVAVCEREGLDAELAKVMLEQARCEAASGAPAPDVAALLGDAARAFDAEGMHGWIRRTEAVAHRLGHGLVGAGRARDRTIFTDDVVGSTASNVRLGDALYLEQLRVHDRLVRARLREFRGVEIKHTGDGINAVFDDPTDAARCALAAQDDVEQWRRSEPDLALRIRIGLAHGPAIPSGGDWFGLVQSEAARLCARAEPGQVLATAPVVHGLPRAELAADPIGPQDLKGLPAAMEAFLLRHR